MDRNFIPHYGRERCKNMMLRLDIPPLDIHKAIQVKDAWEKFTFCRIYCLSKHRKGAELIPHIENRTNNAVVSATLYKPVELFFGAERNNLFQKCLPKLPKREMKLVEIRKKIAKAYENETTSTWHEKQAEVW